MARVRAAVAGRASAQDPPPFPVDSRAAAVGTAQELVGRFRERFERNGGEVVVHASPAEAREWLEDTLDELGAGGRLAIGSGVPDPLRPDRAPVPAVEADVGLSLAHAAAARSGTLVLDSRGGRLVQLLPATHLMLLDQRAIFFQLAEALAACRTSLPSGLGLHSGPSKSADIGRTLVTGVHGPGRAVAVIVSGLSATVSS